MGCVQSVFSYFFGKKTTDKAISPPSPSPPSLLLTLLHSVSTRARHTVPSPTGWDRTARLWT
ncbi:uncharacterized protein LOC124361754 isoform X4 [Homalodisca vitripennis]|uniref:uncharacterized protein LOC124361754 isoform X4 n=1 Tax=Homalodisca vitripennis TaxID=197043 RepID=UPI001EE9C3BD|nr:uncharacterized protein LOC124361754 isoform X4 [Homalodisca vitripennis]